MERTIIETEEYTIVETDNCLLEEIVEFVVKESYPRDEYPNIWHVGRLAIKKHASNDDIVMLKTLMICAIAPIVNTRSSIMLAEIDVKLIHSLRRMGIGLAPIGEPLYYIGSKTFPISASIFDLINYYKKHINSLFVR